MSTETNVAGPLLEADAVLEFLRSNSGFFEQHSDILPYLDIPHRCGRAASLIERQVGILRDRCHYLEEQLQTLISVAQENEMLHQRLHTLVQEIISAESLGDVIALTTDCLRDNFYADDVRVVLLTDEVSEKDDVPDDVTVQVSRSDTRLTSLQDCMQHRMTTCGPLNDEIRSLVYGGGRPALKSAALIPLSSWRQIGLLVLASKDEKRFTSDVGVLFLDQLGDVLSRRLQSFPVAV